jgi:hypothetical protein
MAREMNIFPAVDHVAVALRTAVVLSCVVSEPASGSVTAKAW